MFATDEHDFIPLPSLHAAGRDARRVVVLLKAELVLDGLELSLAATLCHQRRDEEVREYVHRLPEMRSLDVEIEARVLALRKSVRAPTVLTEEILELVFARVLLGSEKDLLG